MILGNIANIGTYKGFHKNVDAIIDFIQTHDLKTLPLGKTEINEECYVNIFDYTVDKERSKRFEGHKDWADIHMTLRGLEGINIANINNLTITTPYDESKDILFGETNQYTSYLLNESNYALVLEEDVHEVKVFAGDTNVVKAVFKFKL